MRIPDNKHEKNFFGNTGERFFLTQRLQRNARQSRDASRGFGCSGAGFPRGSFPQEGAFA
jgi:hypothetical protein